MARPSDSVALAAEIGKRFGVEIALAASGTRWRSGTSRGCHPERSEGSASLVCMEKRASASPQDGRLLLVIPAKGGIQRLS
jgi:hypothetical protein